MNRLLIAATALIALAVATPAASAGLRHVTVVNLMNTTVHAAVWQGFATYSASGNIEAKHDQVFTVHDLAGKITVHATACPNGKSLAMPSKPTDIRFVVNPGCALSIQ